MLINISGHMNAIKFTLYKNDIFFPQDENKNSRTTGIPAICTMTMRLLIANSGLGRI